MAKWFVAFLVFWLWVSCQKLPEEAAFIDKNKVSGVIGIDPNLKGKCDGYLFIVARKADSPQPLAVKRIKSPEYPYKFVLSPADVMIEPNYKLFDGEILIYAKTSKTGNPFEEGGYCETDIKPVKTGSSDVSLILNSYKE